MRLFAIGDLHMSGGEEKPMDVFGAQWDRHFFHICENWRKMVGEEDTVLIPGDISWAMHLEDAAADLEEIGRLPGRKILCKGNHDYWWNSVSRVRSCLPASVSAIQHSAEDLGDCVVCGTRGWLFPTAGQPLTAQDMKIFLRETERLRLALTQAEAMAAGRPVAVMIHYPPLTTEEKDTAFTELLEAFRVSTVVYGHLHGQGTRNGFEGEHHGVCYHLVSCDHLGFCPKEIQIKS